MSLHIRFSIALLRFCNYLYFNKTLRFLRFPFVLLYTIIVRWIFSIDIPVGTRIGKGLWVYHGFGIVIHRDCVVGSNCIIRHGVTIGNKNGGSGVPAIGHSVDIGCNVIILGDIIIGDNVTIGAGAIVTKSIPNDKTVIGVNRIL